MKVEAPFIHLIKLHTKYYLYDVNSKMIVNISNDLFDFFKSNENIKAEIEICAANIVSIRVLIPTGFTVINECHLKRQKVPLIFCMHIAV